MATDYIAAKPTKLWKGTPFVKLDNGDWLLQADKTVPVGTILSLEDPDSYAFNRDGKKASFRYASNMDDGSAQFYVQTFVVDALLNKAQVGALQTAKNYWPKGKTFTVRDQLVGGAKRTVKVKDPSTPLSAQKVYGEAMAYAGGLTPPGYIFLSEFTQTKPALVVADEKAKKPSAPKPSTQAASFGLTPSTPAAPPPVPAVETAQAGMSTTTMIAIGLIAVSAIILLLPKKGG